MYWDNNNGRQPITTYSRDPERSSVDFDSNYFSGYLDLALKKTNNTNKWCKCRFQCKKS